MVDSNYNCCHCSRSRWATCCFYFTLYAVKRIANYVQSLESSDLGVMYKVERKQLDFQTAIVRGDKVRNNLLWLVKWSDLIWDSLKGEVDQEHQEKIWDVPFPNTAVVAVSHQTWTAPQALTLHLLKRVQFVTEILHVVLQTLLEVGLEVPEAAGALQLTDLLVHGQFWEMEEKFYFRLNKVFSVAGLF